MTRTDLINKLKLEYSSITKDLDRIRQTIELEIKCLIKEEILNASIYEKISIETRIKDCDSAINKIFSKYEGNEPKESIYEDLHIKSLKDLIGVRINVFPSDKLTRIEEIIKKNFHNWIYDPVIFDENHKDIFIRKYQGCFPFSEDIFCEIQIAPTLYHSFLMVEHDTLYKTESKLKNITHSLEIKRIRIDILKLLDEYERQFNEIILDQ